MRMRGCACTPACRPACIAARSTTIQPQQHLVHWPAPTSPCCVQHSNNRRALWYTVLEVVTLAGVGAFNVYYVSSMFKGPGGRFAGRIVV